MPVPTHLKPLPLKQESHPSAQPHPLAQPHPNPASPVRHPHFEHHHQHQRVQLQHHHSHPQAPVPQPRSPHHREHQKTHETDPMLPNHSDHHHSPHSPHSPHHPSHHSTHHTHSHHPRPHSENQNQQTHSHPHHELTSFPVPPPKSPKSPTPLSKRLLYALTNKPTLSKTWEKRSFADQQKSAPLDGGQREELGVNLQEYSSPRSRPMSFYASPAEIAAFKPLPMVDPPYPSGDHQHPHSHAHAHSAPNFPAPPMRG
ncbi:hypothetical protein I302_100135 [Kwoniella bestiolae CBS 10118]|uniref:Uncharacterized protein n=1 Tax=Kwoniella bestiolae CBS 10118 TaxID=1296100 RepID=A0A1B9G459_9TREE|nr:hypothetical protein I302_03511 [Kwoniella bestiolae CBS 10118]OCF25837.1 hypothetical protein I302_03511 [Kwoniella bestiolae CBS 10118]